MVDELSGYSTFAESYRPSGEGYPDNKESVSALPSVNIYNTIDVNDAMSYYNGLIGSGNSDHVLFVNQYQKGDVDVNSFGSPYGANVGPRHIPANPDREDDGRSLLVNRTRVAFEMGYLDRMPPEKWDGASYDGPGGIEAPEGTTNWITLPRYPFYDKEDNQHPAGDNDWFGTIDGPNNPGSRVEVFGRPVLAKTVDNILNSLHKFWSQGKREKGTNRKRKKQDSRVLLQKRSKNISVSLAEILSMEERIKFGLGELGGAWRFNVGKYNDVYLSAIHGDDDNSIPSVVFDDHTDVRVKCSAKCKHWQYAGPAYFSGAEDYLFGKTVTQNKPSASWRDYRICKHVYALFMFLKGEKILSKWPKSDKRYRQDYRKFKCGVIPYDTELAMAGGEEEESSSEKNRYRRRSKLSSLVDKSGIVESVVNRVIKRGISDAVSL